jgi:large subunit ribosomal protein L13
MKTHTVKPGGLNRRWYVLDARAASAGRISTQAARLLMGKGKPDFSSHIDIGDFVIVINASQLKITGNKGAGKHFYRHSGYPGGLRRKTLAEVMESSPEEALIHSIRGMLPANKLRAGRLARLKVYAGAEHNHQAQNPTSLTIVTEKDKV